MSCRSALLSRTWRSAAESVSTVAMDLQTFYPVLGTQARRVAEVCKSIATVLTLSAADRHVLESSALLHDIGLVGVQRSLIRKWHDGHEPLSTAEKALIQQHPILGQELAAFSSGLDKVGEVIRAHHEHYDGSGYPDQLVGENIPWLARLLAVVVAYASSPLTSPEAVEQIKTGIGTKFDPEAVRVFLHALNIAPVARQKREVKLGELRPGMILACCIYNANGLMVVSEGQQLNATYIEKLLNHNRFQPLAQSLLVYC